jgi:hypothetical protein
MFSRYRIVFLVLLLLVVGGFAGYRLWPEFAGEKPAPSRSPARTPNPMELQALAERLSGALPSPEQMEEDARIEREQVEMARGWLRDANPQQRVTGAEQLSAYPTSEAEKLLKESLGNDPIPEVRAAAARSLDSFEKIEEITLRALLGALEDTDADVRLNTLNALQNHYYRLDRDSKPKEAKKILADLKKRAKSPRVAVETQQAITDFLSDLQ